VVNNNLPILHGNCYEDIEPKYFGARSQDVDLLKSHDVFGHVTIGLDVGTFYKLISGQ